MGFSYGIGNLGKIIGPLGLALIVGSSNCVSPQVTADALFSSRLFLAFWYGRAGLMFLLVGFETRGARSKRLTAPLRRRPLRGSGCKRRRPAEPASARNDLRPRPATFSRGGRRRCARR